MEVLYRIKGNEPLLLADPTQVWLVRKGNVAVFATKVKDKMPVCDRRYLFSAIAGVALLGAVSDVTEEKGDCQFGLLAIAIEETELSQMSIADLAAKVKAFDAEAIALVEGWINHLGQTFNEVSWGEVWLEKLQTASDVSASLAEIHADFFHKLNLLQQQETETAFRRFQEREELNRQVVKGALGKLAAVLQPHQKAPFSQEGTPLLVAAGAVGRAMGIEIRPPGQSENLNRLKDPVEAIARASQIRTRRVLLEYGWWRKEYGPLLAYTLEDKRPVALLPAPGSRYILFEPATQTRTLVDEAVAAKTAPEAHQFYRPLPTVVVSSPNGGLASRTTYTQTHKGILFSFLYSIKGYQRDIAAIFAVGIMGTLLGMVAPQATALLVDNVIPDSDRSLLWQISLALFAIAFGQSAFQMSQGILSLRVESTADGALQPAIWDRLLRLSPAFFREYSSGDLLNRAMAVSQIRQKLAGGAQRTLLSALFALLNLVLMFVYSWQLALVGVAITLLTAVVTAISSFLMVRKARRQQELNGAINGLTVQLIYGVAKLRVAMAEERAFAVWADRYSQRIRLKAGFQRIDDSVSVFNEALPLVTSALLFWFAILLVQMAHEGGGGGLTSGTFLAFNSALGTFIRGVSDLSNTLTDILGIVPLWERAEPILRAQPEYDPSKADPGTLKGGIALEDVTFRYREDGPLILNNVSLYAKPGEFVAIAGPSGSGKSTIFRLLLGFEKPVSGSVYYDGRDLTELDLAALRRQLGVVLQHGRIGAGSIFDNISGGALVSLDEAWEAARMAGFAEDIERMPMGIHTVISEGGSNLSGGQRQRLLIARSLVLKPKVILMDEATSSLDNRTQAIVTESLDKLKATRIVIAHRLSTIRHADRIYVIDAGRVVQVGTFEELANQDGLFAKLVARQME